MTTLPQLCGPPPVVGHESGALLHPRVVVVTEEEDDADDQPQQICASATTSNGREVRISVRLAPPPATSLVRLRTGDELRWRPCVRAAHGDLLLISMAVVDAAADQAAPNMFVFRAHPACPWLRRLPDAGSTWLRFPAAIVSLPGDGGFIIADLQITLMVDRATGQETEMAYLVRYSSATGQWDVKQLAMPYDGDALQPFRWHTDKVFSSTDGSVYVTDYHHGLLRCDVRDDIPVLRLIRLPEIRSSWKSRIVPAYFVHGRSYSEAYRTAGACNNGTVIFVHVDNGMFGLRKRSGFTVTTWALKMPEFEWEEVSVLRVDDELWPLLNSPLPRCVLQYPMVCTQDEDALHFILQENPCGSEEWMITADMHRKILLPQYENRTNRVGWLGW